MVLKETVGRLFGDEAASDSETEAERGDPSHVCQSCGEEYYTTPGMNIRTCRNCGGVKVEAM